MATSEDIAEAKYRLDGYNARMARIYSQMNVIIWQRASNSMTAHEEMLSRFIEVLFDEAVLHLQALITDLEQKIEEWENEK